jgi:hypothetical protein
MAQSKGRRGSVFALLAVSLVALMACIGIALSTGQLAATKAHLQSHADFAAMAGAGACRRLPAADVWYLAGRYYADNLAAGADTIDPVVAEYTTNGAVYRVGNDKVTVTYPYSDSYTNSRNWNPSRLVAVRAERTIALPLSRPVGVGQGKVVAFAVALAEPVRSGGLAIFAYSSDPAEEGWKWTGTPSPGRIEGNVHSNTVIKWSGSDHHLTGWAEYRYGYSITGSGHDTGQGFSEGDLLEYPLAYAPGDFQPYDYVINGNFKVSQAGTVIPPGVYYVNGDVDISGSGIVAQGVTFIATGKISVSCSGPLFTPARNNVLFYTTSSSAPGYEIDISGSGGRFEGICWAPNGDIQYSGSDFNICQGAFYARTVTVTGSNFTLIGTGEGGSSRVHARLVE